MDHRFTSFLIVCAVCWNSAAVTGWTATPDSAAAEHFEKRVRPLLVEHCQKCHSEKEPKGGLRVDSLSALLRGGDTGPALVPGKPDESLLVEAIEYDPNSYQMPPTGKLSADHIATIREWIANGAVWPGDNGGNTVARSRFNLAERAQHWSFQPLQVAVPPVVSRQDWPQQPLDQFILARLEQAGLGPSPAAERHTLLRRVTFDLTGLPPTVAELQDFAADTSPLAWSRVIDRLLASPHYGERWGRHWLDLVRYAETGGHEFDFEIPHTWRYRDYVTRALNSDLPYDQFVREHIAGDLLTTPRRDPLTGDNESTLATAFYWFGQGKHSPVDIRAEECDTVDNQVDVLSKTFLGLTVACARCHDHKFDAILQSDYYALAGFLQSSRQTVRDISPPAQTQRVVDGLMAESAAAHAQLLSVLIRETDTFAAGLPQRLLSDEPAAVAWRTAVLDAAKFDRTHPFFPWANWTSTPDFAARVPSWVQQYRAEQELATSPETAPAGLQIPAPFRAEVAQSAVARPEMAPSPWSQLEWQQDGRAFDVNRQAPWRLSSDPQRPVRGLAPSADWARSGNVSRQLRGTLRSPTFTITTPYLDYWLQRIGGQEKPNRPNKQGQVHLIVDGFQVIRNPLYGKLTLNVERSDRPKHYRQDVQQFVGSQAYIEIEDLDEGEIIVQQISGSQGAPPPLPVNSLLLQQLAGATIASAADLATAYQQVYVSAANRLRTLEHQPPSAWNNLTDRDALARLLNVVIEQYSPDVIAELQPLAARQQQWEQQLPPPSWALGMVDGTAEDEHLLIRGNHKKPGDAVPREFLQALQPFTREGRLGPESRQHGSGRLELADCITTASNPLTARVMVNRLWQHHFGRGLVPTPDDFGKMGQPPSHPELLDWLAAELIRQNWSLKALHRQMLLSATYQQSSRVTSPRAEELDPRNVWLHRMSIQRLEAEPIRDALLAVSGRLDDRFGGPSVWPHLTPFMEGRGRPGQSGPLDGDGRRSLYLGVRRNFLIPMFLAFDFPTPFTTMGQRSSSNVPAQALTLMNNPLVLQQTAVWADRVRESAPDTDSRLQTLYLQAFSREPTADELSGAREFIAASLTTADEPTAWRDLAHVLVNVKEFVFIE